MVLCSFEEENFFMYHAVDANPDSANFKMHLHQQCEICYFMSGKGYYSIENSTYEPFPGSVLLVRESEAHMLHVSPSSPYERFIIRFTPEDFFADERSLTDLFRKRSLGCENMIICNSDSLTFIQECYKRLQRGIVSGITKTEIISYIRLILAELAFAKENHDQTEISYRNNVNKLASDIVAYINIHLTEIDSMEFIEQNFYFSRSYLNRIFKQTTGSTIWDYIIGKRLMLARSLILAGEAPGVASSKSGFSDYSSFYRQFKNQFGITPTMTKPDIE